MIWCGSLLTHVDASKSIGFVKVFEALLAPGGVAVFTTYGRFTAEALRKRENTLSLEDEQIEGLLRDYDSTGFGYFERLPDLGLGDCVASRAWVGARSTSPEPAARPLQRAGLAGPGRDRLHQARLRAVSRPRSGPARRPGSRRRSSVQPSTTRSPNTICG